jgi:hypothetical protein
VNCPLNGESFFILNKSASLKGERAGVNERYEVSLKGDSRPC